MNKKIITNYSEIGNVFFRFFSVPIFYEMSTRAVIKKLGTDKVGSSWSSRKNKRYMSTYICVWMYIEIYCNVHRVKGGFEISHKLTFYPVALKHTSSRHKAARAESFNKPQTHSLLYDANKLCGFCLCISRQVFQEIDKREKGRVNLWIYFFPFFFHEKCRNAVFWNNFDTRRKLPQLIFHRNSFFLNWKFIEVTSHFFRI